MLGAPWPAGNAEHAALLAAIGRVLGLDGPLPEWRVGAWTGGPDPSDRTPPQGSPAFQVLAGRVDTRHDYVVWVEEYTRGLPGPEDDPDDMVDVLINLDGAGVRHLPRTPQPPWVRRPGSPWISLALEEDRPDLVTDIQSLTLHDDELVALYARGGPVKKCRFIFGAPGGVRVDRTAVNL